jgi:hypothetical protein
MMPSAEVPSKKKVLFTGRSLFEMILMTSEATMPPTTAHPGASSKPTFCATSAK